MLTNKCAFVGLLICGLLLLGLTVPAFATDGVIEINQAKVMAAGGFPFVITQPGSYRLTGNLTITTLAIGIHVKADNVTIDLNGFAVVGPGSASYEGVAVEPANVNTSVRNGTIQNMHSGILLQSGRVENVRAIGNSDDGIHVNLAGIVIGCTVAGNGRYGISLSTGLAQSNLANNNGTHGLVIWTRGGYAGNVFDQNGTSLYGGTNMGGNVCNGVICP